MFYPFSIAVNILQVQPKGIPTIALIFLILPWALAFFYSLYVLAVIYDIQIPKLFRYLNRLPATHVTILQKDFRFYQKLNNEEKQKFENRVNHFLINKTFLGKSIEITDEMRVMISASAVQLTFGLHPVYLSHFNTITIVPAGHFPVYDRKDFTIGWHDFIAGYSDHRDGYNPGLQKIATMLSLEHRICKEKKYIFRPYRYLQWKNTSEKEAIRWIRAGVTRFRSIKEINEHDYFATAVVYFFEQPEDFRSRFPELFDALKHLLRQNPMRYL